MNIPHASSNMDAHSIILPKNEEVSHSAARVQLKQRHAFPSSDEPSQAMTISTTTAMTDASLDDVGSRCSQIPRYLQVSDALRTKVQSLFEVPLTPLEFVFDGTVNDKSPISFKTALKRQARQDGGRKAKVSIVFVVRHTGCASCREHAQQLAELINEFRNVVMWAIVKKDASAIAGPSATSTTVAFHRDHFPFPTYQDENWGTYKALGNRKISSVKLMKGYLAAKRRWADNAIPNRVKTGDVRLQGGILLFSRGKLECFYDEVYGQPLQLADIRSAIKALQDDVSYAETMSN